MAMSTTSLKGQNNFSSLPSSSYLTDKPSNQSQSHEEAYMKNARKVLSQT